MENGCLPPEAESTAERYIALKQSAVYRLLEKEFTSRSYSTMLVLSCLKAHPDTACPHELTQTLARSSAQIAVLLNHMEEQGYIERRSDPHDGRKTVLRILPAGEAFYRAAKERRRRWVQAVFEKMGPEQAEKFVSLFSEFLCAGEAVYREEVLSENAGRNVSGKQRQKTVSAHSEHSG